MKTLTQVCELPADPRPRAKPTLLHEWPCDIPYIPEGGYLYVAGLPAAYKVYYRSVQVDEEADTATVTYVVYDARKKPPGPSR